MRVAAREAKLTPPPRYDSAAMPCESSATVNQTIDLRVRSTAQVNRQWREALALQRALDDKTYKVVGRHQRGNRLLRAALTLIRPRLIKALEREGVDWRKVLSDAAAKREGKRPETARKPMPHVDRPPQVEE